MTAKQDQKQTTKQHGVIVGKGWIVRFDSVDEDGTGVMYLTTAFRMGSTDVLANGEFSTLDAARTWARNWLDGR